MSSYGRGLPCASNWESHPAFPGRLESFILSLWAIGGIIYVILCAAILLKLYYVPSQYAGVKNSK